MKIKKNQGIYCECITPTPTFQEMCQIFKGIGENNNLVCPARSLLCICQWIEHAGNTQIHNGKLIYNNDKPIKQEQ